MNETERVLRAFDMLSAVLEEGRGWITDHDRSVRTGNRRQFRLWTRQHNDFLAVAVFCDVPIGGSADVAASPTVKLVQQAIRTAVAAAGYGDAENGGGDGGAANAGTTEPGQQHLNMKLAILLLRSDSGTTVRQDVQRLLRGLAEQGQRLFWVELWHVRDLQYNVLRLKDVPKHARLTAEQVTALPVRGGPDTLPLMLASDPVARAMHFVPGDVIRIHRQDSRFGASVYWRRVVEAAEHVPVKQE